MIARSPSSLGARAALLVNGHVIATLTEAALGTLRQLGRRPFFSPRSRAFRRRSADTRAFPTQEEDPYDGYGYDIDEGGGGGVSVGGFVGGPLRAAPVAGLGAGKAMQPPPGTGMRTGTAMLNTQGTGTGARPVTSIHASNYRSTPVQDQEFDPLNDRGRGPAPELEKTADAVSLCFCRTSTKAWRAV